MSRTNPPTLGQGLAYPLIALLAMAAGPGAAGQGAGSAVFDQTTFDFGEIVEGDPAEHAFVFRNGGTAPVRLVEVKPACGCTTPEWTSDPVAPGHEGTITARYASLGRPGPFHKAIEVHTDGNPATTTLYIAGNVVPPAVNPATADRQGGFLIAEESIDFGDVPPGDEVVHTFLLKNAGDRPIRILDARSFAHNVAVKFNTNPVFAGEVARVEVTVVTAVEPGPAFDHAVVLKTDDETQPLKSLRLVGRLKSPFAAGGS